MMCSVYLDKVFGSRVGILDFECVHICVGQMIVVVITERVKSVIRHYRLKTRYTWMDLWSSIN